VVHICKIKFIFKNLIYYPVFGDTSVAFAEQNTKTRYRQYIDSISYAFLDAYYSFCTSSPTETFTGTYANNEYHYTLYYYDRAGNLVKTVPPEGVNPLTNAQLPAVKAYRDAITNNDPNPPAPVLPAHTLATEYHYTSFNQIKYQNTPDGGSSNFWYDALGRLAASQNAKQAVPEYIIGGPPDPLKRYSYTVYDGLGRITEVCETHSLTNPTDAEINDQLWPGNFGSYNHQITKTYYDNEIPGIGLGQQNLRSWVASITYTHNKLATDYDYGSHYSYDIHGNVDKLVQEDKSLAGVPGNADMKTIEYEYDLISGNVNLVKYQEGYTDQFYHKYFYDEDNRLKWVRTSTDGIIWDEDANYFYYLHGPLSRIEIGDNKIQGIDYAYTIHGWIKGINSNIMDMQRDIGQDAYQLQGSGKNGAFGRDAFSYSLSYYAGDYSPINQIPSISYFLSDMTGSEFGNTDNDLFNGNIHRMVTNFMDNNEMVENPSGNQVYLQGTKYKYDQLNRLKEMKVHTGVDMQYNQWTQFSERTIYETHLSYDANGNIAALTRNDGNGAPMDNFDYKYDKDNNGTGSTLISNKLYHIIETVNGSAPANDIEPFPGVYNGNSGSINSANNYGYDDNGNLIRDNAEEIETIEWTVYGKIKKISRTAVSTKPDIEFAYGPDGNRIKKKVIFKNGDPDEFIYYTRDAQGNVMATYTIYEQSPNNWKQQLKEQHIYGSSRLGYRQAIIDVDVLASTNDYRRELGYKRYELSNHLGNVISVISDEKIAYDNGSGSVANYSPNVVSATDFYPFGMQMPGRSFSSGSYRYGFNGKESDDEVSGTGNQYDYGFRIYNPRIGKFLSVDPLTGTFAMLTPYQFASNTPIMAIDLDGLESSISIHEIWIKGNKIIYEDQVNKSGFDSEKGPWGMGPGELRVLKTYDVSQDELGVIVINYSLTYSYFEYNDQGEFVEKYYGNYDKTEINFPEEFKNEDKEKWWNKRFKDSDKGGGIEWSQVEFGSEYEYESTAKNIESGGDITITSGGGNEKKYNTNSKYSDPRTEQINYELKKFKKGEEGFIIIDNNVYSRDTRQGFESIKYKLIIKTPDTGQVDPSGKLRSITDHNNLVKKIKK
jgi:RHS repeat-associated protein